MARNIYEIGAVPAAGLHRYVTSRVSLPLPRRPAADCSFFDSWRDGFSTT
jgi:hypothetical protein